MQREARDWEPGKYITVVKSKKYRDQTYRGDVLKILLIEEPFIVVEVLTGKHSNRRVSLDADFYTFQEVTEEYVAKMTVKKRPELRTADAQEGTKA
jgi:hypothetical protein